MFFDSSSLDWVGVAGISGFVLSLAVFVHLLYSRRLKLSIKDSILMDDAQYPEALFLTFILSNKTSLPVSVTALSIRVYKNTFSILKRGIYYNADISQQVSTFCNDDPPKGRSPVPPTVFSTTLPLRLDSYESKRVCLKVHCHDTKSRILEYVCPGKTPYKVRHIPLLFHIQKLCTRQLLPVLVLDTSRGRRDIALCTDLEQGTYILHDFAARKATAEGRIDFS
jgi:hypothetical protein